MRNHEHATPYRNLILMLLLSFAAMYGLMYAMVDSFANVYMNLNQFYMALLMAASMGPIELLVMRAMYPDKRLNAVLMAATSAVLVVSWLLIRQQIAIGDAQFLRSMIPHHGGAILMCGEAPVTDPRITALCRSIIESQQSEIAQMKALLGEPRR